MTRGRYKQVHAGEWVTPVMNGYKLMCCDCGLVHNFKFRIKGKSIEMCAFRVNESTKRARKHQKIFISKAGAILLGVDPLLQPVNLTRPPLIAASKTKPADARAGRMREKTDKRNC